MAPWPPCSIWQELSSSEAAQARACSKFPASPTLAACVRLVASPTPVRGSRQQPQAGTRSPSGRRWSRASSRPSSSSAPTRCAISRTPRPGRTPSPRPMSSASRPSRTPPPRWRTWSSRWRRMRRKTARSRTRTAACNASAPPPPVPATSARTGASSRSSHWRWVTTLASRPSRRPSRPSRTRFRSIRASPTPTSRGGVFAGKSGVGRWGPPRRTPLGERRSQPPRVLLAPRAQCPASRPPPTSPGRQGRVTLGRRTLSA